MRSISEKIADKIKTHIL